MGKGVENNNGEKVPTEAAPTEGPAAADDAEELARHSAVITAGSKDQAGKKRGGQKETGGSKRLRKRLEEDGPKKEKDPDRWIKLKLAGEKSQKKIDATRVVHYHDFDTYGKLFESKDSDDEAPAPAAKAEQAGNFRATLRMDLFAPESDEEEDEKAAASQSSKHGASK